MIVPSRLLLAGVGLFGLTILSSVGAAGVQGGAQSPPAPPAQAAPAPAPAAGYVGSDTCVLCHTDQENTLKGTAHAQVLNPRSPTGAVISADCGSCHEDLAAPE